MLEVLQQGVQEDRNSMSASIGATGVRIQMFSLMKLDLIRSGRSAAKDPVIPVIPSADQNLIPFPAASRKPLASSPSYGHVTSSALRGLSFSLCRRNLSSNHV
ncbi:unnamed protein product [Merluccius merluccius]